MKRVETVTWGGWSVSVTTGSPKDGAVLNVSRHYEPGRDGTSRYIMAKGELDGAIFATSEEASAAALARGYTQPYRRAREERYHRPGEPRPERRSARRRKGDA